MNPIHVVSYSPVQNFFYNDPLGANLVVLLFAIGVSIVAGYMTTSALSTRSYLRSNVWSNVAGVVAGFVTLALIRYLVTF